MPKNTLVALLVAVVMLLGGVALIVLGRHAAQKARASRAWPTTQGVVVATSIDITIDDDGNDTYTPIVRYRYAVNGKTYESKRMTFGGHTSFSNDFDAEAFLKDYPVNASVTVHYNPADPAEAVLDTSASNGRALMFIGGFFVFIGLVFMAGYVSVWRLGRRFEGT